MISEKEITAVFSKAEQVKLSIASQADLSQLGSSAITQLESTKSNSGTIRVLSDTESRWSAHHFNEELVVRFKAGSEFGRDDRPAINSRQYSEYKFSDILALIKADRFDVAKDSLVVFASIKPDPELVVLVKTAHAAGFPLIVIAPQSQSELLAHCKFAFSIPATDPGIILSIHNTFLHAVCEGFEPEYNIAKHDFSEIFRKSAEVDKKLSADKELLTLIEKTNSRLTECIGNGATLFIAGNGGSTCEANSLAEFARTLGDNNGNKFEVFELHAADVLLCAYNDNHQPFARQIDANGRAGDVLLIYSTSGNSQNIIDAVNKANALGLYTIGLLGKNGGKLAPLCSSFIVVSAMETSRIQEAHAIIGQLLLQF